MTPSKVAAVWLATSRRRGWPSRCPRHARTVPVPPMTVQSRWISDRVAEDPMSISNVPWSERTSRSPFAAVSVAVPDRSGRLVGQSSHVQWVITKSTAPR